MRSDVPPSDDEAIRQLIRLTEQAGGSNPPRPIESCERQRAGIRFSSGRFEPSETNGSESRVVRILPDP